MGQISVEIRRRPGVVPSGNQQFLADWVEENIATGADLPRNPHWMPFSAKARLALKLNLKVLLTPDLSPQLAQLLGPALAGPLSGLEGIERNSSGKDDRAAAVLNRRLNRRISALYARDMQAYRRAQAHWQETGTAPRADRVWGSAGERASPPGDRTAGEGT